MLPPQDWVPMRWRASDSLDWLRGTPVNCLVADSTPPQAQGRGLAVVSLGGREASWPSIPCAPLSKAPWRGSSPVFAISDGVWPQIRAAKDQVAGGPTGLPWIDSGGWAIRLARALAPGMSVWMVSERPKDLSPASPEDYLLAIADAAAHGGRWVIDLDDGLRSGLAAGNQAAVNDWRRIASAVALFESHKEWRLLPALGVLAVVSDFSSANEFLATETLNLLARRLLAYRILEKSKAEAAALEGLKAILYVDQEPPAPGLSRKFLSFAGRGNLLVVPRSCAFMADGLPPAAEPHPRFDVRTSGEGRIAVARADWDDPYAVAVDTHMLLSHRNDLVHVYNASAISSYCTGSEDGSRMVVHLLNFTKRLPSAPATLGVRFAHRSARMWSLGGGAPAPLQSTREGNWFELPLPPFAVYAAMELRA